MIAIRPRAIPLRTRWQRHAPASVRPVFAGAQSAPLRENHPRHTPGPHPARRSPFGPSPRGGAGSARPQKGPGFNQRVIPVRPIIHRIPTGGEPVPGWPRGAPAWVRLVFAGAQSAPLRENHPCDPSGPHPVGQSPPGLAPRGGAGSARPLGWLYPDRNICFPGRWPVVHPSWVTKASACALPCQAQAHKRVPPPVRKSDHLRRPCSLGPLPPKALCFSGQQESRLPRRPGSGNYEDSHRHEATEDKPQGFVHPPMVVNPSRNRRSYYPSHRSHSHGYAQKLSK